jgi:lipopolysaccharide biosynthesis glycosyltransferase
MKATVTFFGDCSVTLAEIMLESARKLNCELVQLTDEKTPKLNGVDTVKRLPYEGDFGAFRLKHFMDMGGDVLHLDYDLIVNRGISDLFRNDFDVGLTNRGNDKTVSEAVRQASPHNMGVVLSTGTEFWKEVYEAYEQVELKNWMLIQLVTTDVARKTHLKVMEFDGSIYNYTPLTETENVDDKAIVHYKGPRKSWMVRHATKQLRKSA